MARHRSNPTRSERVMDVSFAGNVCDEPQLRHTRQGKAVTDLRIAVNRTTPDREGGWHQETAFYSVVAWHTLAERVAKCLYRGDRVVVIGRMKQEEWTTERGEPRSRYVIHAEDIAASV